MSLTEKAATLEDLREILRLDDEDLTELTIWLRLDSPVEIAELTAGLVNKTCLVKLDLDGAYQEFPDALAPFLEAVFPSHPNLRQLSLSSNTLTAAHMPPIADIINNNHNLKVLDLSRNPLGIDGAQALAEGLIGNDSLEELHLYDTDIEAEGLIVIAEAAFEMSGLKSLNLSGNVFERDQTATIRFVDMIANNLRLEELNFGDVFAVEDPGALTYFIRTVLLSRHPSLRKVGLNGNNITTEQLALIASAIQSNRNLTELDISSNDIGNNGARIIAQGIRGLQSLQKLDLCGNEVGPEGLVAIATALQTTGIICLDLTANRLIWGNYYTALFLDAFLEFPQMEELKLEQVFEFDDSALALFHFVKIILPSLRSLRVLDLSHNNAGGELHVEHIANFIRGNKTLQRLMLHGNRIDDNGYEEIATSLGQNSTLVRLTLVDNANTRRGTASMIECVRTSNYTLKELRLDERTEPVLRDIMAGNRRLRNAINRNRLSIIPPFVWPRVMALAKEKPELLFMILKSDPTVMERL